MRWEYFGDKAVKSSITAAYHRAEHSTNNQVVPFVVNEKHSNRTKAGRESAEHWNKEEIIKSSRATSAPAPTVAGFHDFKILDAINSRTIWDNLAWRVC